MRQETLTPPRALMHRPWPQLMFEDNGTSCVWRVIMGIVVLESVTSGFAVARFRWQAG